MLYRPSDRVPGHRVLGLGRVEHVLDFAARHGILVLAK
jgi:hypothetical protein